MKIICSECGKEYSDEEKNCIYCGAKTANNRYINNNVNRYSYTHNTKNAGIGVLQLALSIGIIFVIVVFIFNTIDDYKQWQKEEIITYNNNVTNNNLEIQRMKITYPVLANSIRELKTIPVNLVETENIFNLNYKISIYEKENITIDNQNMEIINKYNLMVNSFNQIFQ